MLGTLCFRASPDTTQPKHRLKLQETIHKKHKNENI